MCLVTLPVATYTLHPDTNARCPHVGILGDIGVLRDVTGVDASRVQNKVKRSYGKFRALTDRSGVHLLVLEVDNTIHLAHVAEALHGREVVTFTREGYAGSGRESGGMFSRGQFSRLDGVVIARRDVRYRLFASYTFALFPNPGGALHVNDVVGALGVGDVLGPTDFP